LLAAGCQLPAASQQRQRSQNLKSKLPQRLLERRLGCTLTALGPWQFWGYLFLLPGYPRGPRAHIRKLTSRRSLGMSWAGMPPLLPCQRRLRPALRGLRSCYCASSRQPPPPTVAWWAFEACCLANHLEIQCYRLRGWGLPCGERVISKNCGVATTHRRTSRCGTSESAPAPAPAPAPATGHCHCHCHCHCHL
jgi:hypothetical protein